MSVMMPEDARDAGAARAGDGEAFARLYTRHAPVVLALCRQGLPQAEAEDACQETFLRAYRKLDQLRSDGDLRPWLYTIARHVCSERRRSATRRRHHEEQAVMDLHLASAPTAPSAPSDMAERVEQLDRLTAALDRLPDDERLAIHLCYLDPNPPAAASEALNLSRASYYRLVHRARSRLAAWMKEVPAR